ncbi:MAG: hypothetical protein WAW39_29485 [Prosthecobacter sp.]|uniref:hypothetical protein n=1 Tax=Prosthecobacter sp. TaxID=1965333 RepID=UPI003BB0F541
MESKKAQHVMILDLRNKLVRVDEIFFGQALSACGKKFTGHILEGSERRRQFHRAGRALRWQSKNGFGEKEPHVFGLQARGELAVAVVEKMIQPGTAGQGGMDEFVDVRDGLATFGRQNSRAVATGQTFAEFPKLLLTPARQWQ